jgi:hypothetical protein
MADGVNFDGLTEELDVFDCPNCHETIDEKADVCRFCGAKIDHGAAEKAAHLLARVDEACSDASYLRNTAVVAFCLLAGALYVFLRSGRLIVAVGFQNFLMGFCALALIVSSPFPIWSMRWWTRCASVQSDDEDFQSARITVRSTGLTAAGALLFFGVTFCWVLVSRIAHR